MKKRILAAAMSLLLLLALLPTAVAEGTQTPAAAPAASDAALTVTANPTTAKPGETIQFMISVSGVAEVTSLEAFVEIPEGLKVVSADLNGALQYNGVDMDNSYFEAYNDKSAAGMYHLSLEALDDTITLDETDGTSLAVLMCEATGTGEATVNIAPEGYTPELYTADSEDPLNVTTTNATVNVAIPVESVTVYPNAHLYDGGLTQNLGLKITPDDATNRNWKFESSDPDIATVVTDDSGWVGIKSGNKTGTATLTITTEDGSKTAQCVVTVEHNISANWEYDDTNHWHVCRNHADYKEDVGAHVVGTPATCTKKAVCAECGAEFGDYAAHKLTKIEAVAPSNLNAGNIEYYKCSECGKLFKDENGTEETKQEDTVLPALDSGKYEWKSEDDNYHSASYNGTTVRQPHQYNNQSYEVVPGKEPSYTSEGEGYLKCVDCGYVDKSHTITLDMITHEHDSNTLVHHDAVDPTCDKDGNIEYWECSICHAKFLDAAGSQSFVGDVTLPAAHDLSLIDAEPATCQQAGNKQYYECTVCHKKFWDYDCNFPVADGEEIIPADPNAHNLIGYYPAQESNCTDRGHEEFWQCATCEKFFYKTGAGTLVEGIPYLPLNPNKHYYYGSDGVGQDGLRFVEETPASCAKDGVKAHYVCDGCGKQYLDEEGQNEVTEADLVIPATGAHEFDTSTWSYNNTTHWHACKNASWPGCHAKQDEAEHTFVYGDWSQWYDYNADDEDADGEDWVRHRTAECEVCGYETTDWEQSESNPTKGDTNPDQKPDNGGQNNGGQTGGNGSQNNGGQTTNTANGNGQTNGAASATSTSKDNKANQTKTDAAKAGVKTGDQSMIEISLIVMGVAAVTLVTVLVVSKKRSNRA